MKTQIIHLDENDDLISTKDKLMWVKMPRVVLVIPHKVRILNHPLDLPLLQRYARCNGYQFAIVTNQKELVSRCEELKISHFPSAHEAQLHDQWKTQRRVGDISRQKPVRRALLIKSKREVSSMKKGLSIPIRILLLASVVFVVLFAVMFFIPSAIITINPDEKFQSRQILFGAGQVVEEDGATFLPIAEISIPLIDTLVIPATGTVTIPEGYATGIVRFENLAESSVGIPQGTVVLSSQELTIKFVTLEEAIVPAGLGKSVDIEARALEAGLRGNIEKEEITVVEGLLGSMVSVTNVSAFNGGGEKEVTAPTPDDWQTLESALLERLGQACESALGDKLLKGDLFLPGTNTIIINQRTSFPAETQPADLIAITMDVECKGFYVANDVIQESAARLLDEDLPSGYIDSGNLTIIETSRVVKSGETYHWNMTFERMIKTRIIPDDIIRLSLGKKQETATQYIQDYLALDTQPVIDISPRWWIRLPLLAWRFQLEIEE